MKRYYCSYCGCYYEPEEGNEDLDIKPGTAFEDIPNYERFVCTTCGSGKEEFIEETDTDNAINQEPA